MYSYKFLENISIETLHNAFVQAFSDYQVKIDLPLWKFEQMLKRRGYTPGLSMGTFNNEELIGFILNGIRSWDGKSTAYDTGTGVLKKYRKQGITSSIFQKVSELLKEKGVEQYLLEVIRTNTAALELYSKQGFKSIRGFQCFRLDKDKFKAINCHKVGHIDKITADTWRCLANFWDFKPSWQNSIESIQAVPEEFIYSIVRLNNAIIGYGIIDKRTGDIPQLAVNKDYRGKGIARSIVTDLLNSTLANKAAMLNVDEECRSMQKFLLKIGFEESVGQYEMLLDLSGC